MKTIKICVAGSKGCGKKLLLHTYSSGEFPKE